MNTFNITLAPFTERDSATGCSLSFRSSDGGNVEIWVRVPRPVKAGGNKGTVPLQFEELGLGRVHHSDLARVLGALHSLMGGCQP